MFGAFMLSVRTCHIQTTMCTLGTIFKFGISAGRLSLAIGPVSVGKATSQGPGYAARGGRSGTSCLQLGVSAAIRSDHQVQDDYKQCVEFGCESLRFLII